MITESTISNERMEAFIQTISNHALSLMQERSEDLLKSWNENIVESDANQTPFPPLKIAISATVDIQKAAIETKIRFTSTYQSELKSELPDPSQPSLF